MYKHNLSITNPYYATFFMVHSSAVVIISFLHVHRLTVCTLQGVFVVTNSSVPVLNIVRTCYSVYLKVCDWLWQNWFVIHQVLFREMYCHQMVLWEFAMFLLSHMLTVVLGLHLRELLLFPTAGWQYGIDECQWEGPRNGGQDPTSGRSQSGYPKQGTTLLGSSYLFTFGN